MARIRTVKPEFFKHEELFDVEVMTKLPIRLAWIGLFCVADREGRFKWKPRALKADILPFDDGVDFEKILDAMWVHGLIVKYSHGGELYAMIPKFTEHQKIRPDEAASRIPSPTESGAVEFIFGAAEITTRIATDTDPRESASGQIQNELVERKGKERKGKEVEEEGSKGSVAGEFKVHELLDDNPTLVSVLQHISFGVQQAWVDRYEIEWLKSRLLDAIHHHLNKENAKSPAQIRDWGKRLVKWLRYEKKPLLIESGANARAEIEALEAQIQKNGGVAP